MGVEGVVALADEESEPEVVAAGDDDPAAGLERFLANDYARLVVAVTAISGDRATAEDAVAEAVARGMRAVTRGTEIDEWDRWIFVVARNHERNRLRRVIRRPDFRSREDTSDNTDGLADGQVVREALRRLPRRQREVVVLHYYLALPVREIAGRLGLSDGAVKNALFNARATLRADLDDAAGEEGAR